MKYWRSKQTVKLGDIVSVPVPEGEESAKVVMFGDTYEHLDIDAQFIAWVKAERVLQPDSIVIEWLTHNPFIGEAALECAPVGNYMSTALDMHVRKHEG